MGIQSLPKSGERLLHPPGRPVTRFHKIGDRSDLYAGYGSKSAGIEDGRTLHGLDHGIGTMPEFFDGGTVPVHTINGTTADFWKVERQLTTRGTGEKTIFERKIVPPGEPQGKSINKIIMILSSQVSELLTNDLNHATRGEFVQEAAAQPYIDHAPEGMR